MLIDLGDYWFEEIFIKLHYIIDCETAFGGVHSKIYSKLPD